MRIHALLPVMGILFLVSLMSACSSAGRPDDSGDTVGAALVKRQVLPADTGVGIDSGSANARPHYVVYPREVADRRGELVLFLPGTAAAAASYSDLADFVASMGYPVIVLDYPNRSTLGAMCGERAACYGEARGEVVYGANVAYTTGSARYDSDVNSVNAVNSISNRTLGVLDFLAAEAESVNNPSPAEWLAYIRRDATSPYVAQHFGRARPIWSSMLVSGHSQGGGHAAFLGQTLPSAEAPVRIVLFSAIQDHTGDAENGVSAPWVTARPRTPLNRYFGLRHADEGNLGDFVARNWQNLGGAARGGLGGLSGGPERVIGDGSGNPEGAHRLVINQPPVNGHLSTANNVAYQGTVRAAWRYLFSI